MPGTQIATQGNFDFGAPATAGEVLRFRTNNGEGGKLVLLFECPSNSANNLTVSLQVAPAVTSSEGVVEPDTFVATTAPNNLAAVTNLVVQKGCTREVTILLRRDTDAFLRLVASGATRGIMQVRGDSIMEQVYMDNTATPPVQIN